jgi:hypothetical protein
MTLVPVDDPAAAAASEVQRVAASLPEVPGFISLKMS